MIFVNTILQKFKVEVLETARISGRMLFVWMMQIAVLTYISWMGLARLGMFENYASWIIHVDNPLLVSAVAIESFCILFTFSAASFRILGLLIFIIEWGLFLQGTVGSNPLYLLLPLPLLFSPFRNKTTLYEVLIHLPVVGGWVGLIWPDTPEPEVVLFFDEECMMCNALLVFLSKRSLSEKLRFAGLKSRSFETLNAEYGYLEGLDTLVVVARRESRTTVRIKSRAVLWIMGQLPGWTKLALIFTMLPTLWADWLYDLVAKYRKRFQKSDSCPVPPKSITQRLLP